LPCHIARSAALLFGCASAWGRHASIAPEIFALRAIRIRCAMHQVLWQRFNAALSCGAALRGKRVADSANALLLLRAVYLLPASRAPRRRIEHQTLAHSCA